MTNEPAAADITGGYFLTWPLYVIVHLQCIPPKQRDWAKGRLFRIAAGFGLGNEQVMAMAEQQVLSNGPKFP